jgi:drug/metabolite transporter (DMT)-like permease
VLRIYLVLFVGVLIASFSSILIRWTGLVPFSIIAFYRLFISSSAILVYRGVQWKRFPAPKASYILAGFFLAVHFITWIASLQLTSIANSVFLESTHPIWAVLISMLFLKEFPHRRTIPAFFIAITGMLIIVSTDYGQGESRLLGDILAVISAISLSFYLLIARIYRALSDIIGYLFYVYASAAIICALYVVVNGDHFFGYNTFSWWMMILLALGPHLFGHSLLNWSSRKIEIYKVNLVLLLEPVLVTFAAMFLFHEFPTARFYVGALFIIVAIGYMFHLEQNRLKTKTGRKK